MLEVKIFKHKCLLFIKVKKKNLQTVQNLLDLGRRERRACIGYVVYLRAGLKCEDIIKI